MDIVDEYSSKIYQRDRKGFTLIELLAVIAILAILVVIAVPNIMKMYRNAKLNTFITQVQNIYKAANNKIMIDQLNNEKITRFYYAGENEENPVDLNGNKEVYYDIEADDTKIKKIIVSTAEYSIDLENINGINVADITKEDVKLKDEEGYISVITDIIYNPKIYGVEFNINTGVYTRLNDAVGMTFSNPTTNNQITSDFDSAQIYKEMTEVTDSYGNQFIKIPKFYIKKTVNGDNTIWTYQISKKKQDSSYYLPACFVDEDTGEVYPYILVGKYNASLSADGLKLESKTGKLPLISKAMNLYRSLAIANGAGYQLLDIHTLDVLQTLFYIEFATLDSSNIMKGFEAGTFSYSEKITSINGTTLTLPSGSAAKYKIGQLIAIGTETGNRDIAKDLRIKSISGDTITYELIPGISVAKVGSISISVNHYVFNVPYINGLTDNITSSSGSYIDNISGEYPMKYRGMENLYNSIWQYIDGINIDGTNNQAYIAYNAKEYASDVFTDAYTPLGYTNALGEGFVTKMGYDLTNPSAQLPSALGQSSISKYKSYYYRNNGNRVAQYGGAWSCGLYGGISAWWLLYTSTNTLTENGARLVKTP